MSRPPHLLRFGLAHLVLSLLGMSLLGCASSQTTRDVDERMRALGTWEYRATGVRALRRGRLKISSRDGELVGQFQDRMRGRFKADIHVQGARMVITVDQLRITGRILDNQYSGTIEQSNWDVTEQNSRRQSRARFEARRVRRGGGSGATDRYGCPSLLREESYACSPFRPQ